MMMMMMMMMGGGVHSQKLSQLCPFLVLVNLFEASWPDLIDFDLHSPWLGRFSFCFSLFRLLISDTVQHFRSNCFSSNVKSFFYQNDRNDDTVNFFDTASNETREKLRKTTILQDSDEYDDNVKCFFTRMTATTLEFIFSIRRGTKRQKN